LERLLITSNSMQDSPGSISAWRTRVAPDLVGDDPALIEVLDMVKTVAVSGSTVLLLGESGTGKEELARALHNGSPRRDKAFVAVNCAAIPETLIEAELFGHARGAFTGADRAREGLVASADGGTLFLDEIGDMPASAQAKLLRVLQSQSITPVGSDRSVRVDVRVVAATHCDLEELIAQKRFRADLFYRLSVIPIFLPALRERPNDILPLARAFVARIAKRLDRPVPTLDASAESALLGHQWPGNIRELMNAIERAVVLCRPGMPIRSVDLRLSLKRRPPLRMVQPAATVDHSASELAALVGSQARAATGGAPVAGEADSKKQFDLKSALDDVERAMIERALAETRGNRTEAAALLGLNRSTLVEKLRKLAG
jgi:transcriptional regulator with PAS, ATPase and Fis domain